MTERAGHILAEVSQGLGIVLMPRLAGSVLNHIRFLLLPDGRVVVVLLSAGGVTRDKIVRPEQEFTQAELDGTAAHLNTHYAGQTLEAIRADLLTKLKTERERYGRLAPGRFATLRSGGAGQRCRAADVRGRRCANRFRTGARRRGTVARTAVRHRGEGPPGGAAGHLHRGARAGPHSDWREGNQRGWRASGADCRAVFGRRSGQEARWACSGLCGCSTSAPSLPWPIWRRPSARR